MSYQVGRFVALTSLLLLFAMLVGGSRASATSFYTAGHADLGIALEDNQLHLHLHVEGGVVDGTVRADEEFDPAEVRIVVSAAHLALPDMFDQLVGADTQLGMSAGELFWKIPQSDAFGLLYLGLGREEIPTGQLLNNQVALELVSVIGPGNFAMWSVPGGVRMSSLDGINEPAGDDTLAGLSVGLGAHTHFNYGFTHKGRYDVTLRARGVLNDGNATAVSDVATFTFLVTPEPSAAVLLAIGLVPLMFRWRRKAIGVR